jgi:hypothetical protein
MVNIGCQQLHYSADQNRFNRGINWSIRPIMRLSQDKMHCETNRF